MLPGWPSCRARISPSLAASASAKRFRSAETAAATRPCCAPGKSSSSRRSRCTCELITPAWPLAHFGHELARLALKRGHVGHRKDIDVVVPHALHQFRRDDAGGAVARWGRFCRGAPCRRRSSGFPRPGRRGTRPPRDPTRPGCRRCRRRTPAPHRRERPAVAVDCRCRGRRRGNCIVRQRHDFPPREADRACIALRKQRRRR